MRASIVHLALGALLVVATASVAGLEQRDKTLIGAVAFVVGVSTWPLYRLATRIADRVVFRGRATPYEVLTSFTLFAESDGNSHTRVQINAKMRTQVARKGSSGRFRPLPVYQCASTGRFEANLLDAVREFVKE